MLNYHTGVAGSLGSAMGMAAHLLELTLSMVQMALAQYYEHGLATTGLSDALASFAYAGTGGVLGDGDVSIRSGGNHANELGGVRRRLSPSDIVTRIAVLPESALAGFTATRPVPRQDMRPRLAKLLGFDPVQCLTKAQIAGILSGNRADGWPIDGKQVQRASKSLATALGLDPSVIPNPVAVDAILAGKRADGGEIVGPKSQVTSLRRRFLSLYGVRGPQPSPEALAYIRAGCRADGRPIDPRKFAQGLTASRAAIGYVDLCWSADKTVSLAWAFAPTEAERNIIAQAHRDAVDTAMRHVESEIGRARKGKAGRAGYEPGAIGWIAFEHYTSRPTVEIVRNDPATGEPYIEIVSLKVAGDPQLHTHVAVPNIVLTESGRIGALDLQRLEGRIHEWGALYQAHLASNLRRAGIEVALDPERGSARIVAIPEAARAAFSKRTEGGVDAARRYAKGQGLDWDRLSPDQKIGLAKRGVQGNPRQVKQDDLSDWASWRRQADAIGWWPRSVIRPDQAVSTGLVADPTSVAEAGNVAAVAEERIEIAYEAALGLLERDLGRRAVLNESLVRTAAARGLIASGITDARDIDAVMAIFLVRGARQGGEMVSLIRREVDPASRRPAQLITASHVSPEAGLINVARAVGADQRGSLDSTALDTAISQAKTDLAGTALDRFLKAEQAVMVPGGYREAVEEVADLWQRLQAAHCQDPTFTVTVSVPSIDDVRAIAFAIRDRRRAAGEIGADQAIVPACDHAGHNYDLRLAPGDRVRLFARTNGRYPDRSRGIIGNNGSVLEVMKLDADGVTLRNVQGREGLVLWNTLRAPGSGRVRLAYGDVLTIDAAQVVTSTAHILALPAGSLTFVGTKAHAVVSWYRAENHLVLSEEAERREVMGRRPPGDTRAIGTAELWENVARNFSRLPIQESVTAFMERAHQVNRSASRALQAGFRAVEQRAVEGKEPTTLTATWRHRRMVTKITEIVTVTKEAVKAQTSGLMDMAYAVRRAINASLQIMLPAIRHAVDTFVRRPEQVARREELAELRNDWVRRQMNEWHDRDGAAYPMPAYNGGADWRHAVQAQEKRSAMAESTFRQKVKQLSLAELQSFAAEHGRAQQVTGMYHRPR